MNNRKLQRLSSQRKNPFSLFLTGTLLIALLAAAVFLALPVRKANAQTGKFRTVAEPVAGEYIVVFNTASVPASAISEVANNLTATHGGTRRHTYTAVMRGFSLQSTEAAALALSRDPRVEFVSQSSVVRTSGVTTQNNPPSWGLDRIDQINRSPNSPNTNNTKYVYSSRGEGVTAYIIDTGIRFDHQDFGTRASLGTDLMNDGRNGVDCEGHGTFVAGIVGGTIYGVAKGVTLKAVRAFDCFGDSTSALTIAGIDWVTNNKSLPAVANMSFSAGGVDTAMDLAVNNMINAGVVAVIAAGNDDQDVSLFSPARVANAITVAASDYNDARAIYTFPQASNFGTGVDLFAPGFSIISAFYTTTFGSTIYDGTSFAAPHVAGVAAQFLQINKAATPATVSSSILAKATPGKITDLQGSPNLLLHSDFMDAASVNAASYLAANDLAPDSVVAVYGYALATVTAQYTSGPVPTQLGGTTVKVRDALNVERDAPLLGVSPGQVNYVIPSGTANGNAIVTITSSNGSKTLGPATIAPTGPGIFAANATGSGQTAGYILRITSGGVQTYENIYQCSGGTCTPIPINLGPVGDSVSPLRKVYSRFAN